jgi:hypothetical protein
LGWSDLDLFFLASLRDRIKIDPDPESDSKWSGLDKSDTPVDFSTVKIHN